MPTSKRPKATAVGRWRQLLAEFRNDVYRDLQMPAVNGRRRRMFAFEAAIAVLREAAGKPRRGSDKEREGVQRDVDREAERHAMASKDDDSK